MDTKAFNFAKRLFILVLPIILIFSLVSCKDTKEQYPQPTDKFFTNDFAAVLTAEDSEKIYNAGVALQKATTAQAIVITIDSLDGKTVSDYALEIGRAWGVGDADKNNGVVILFSKNDREIYVSVGYGLEGALPDSKTGRIIDNYAIPYFTGDNFSTGLMSVYNAIVNEIYIEYGLTPQENYVPIDQLPTTDAVGSKASEVLVSWLVLIVLIALYIIIFGRRGGMFIFSAPRFYGGFNNHSNFRGGFGGGGGSFGGGGAGRKF